MVWAVTVPLHIGVSCQTHVYLSFVLLTRVHIDACVLLSLGKLAKNIVCNFIGHFEMHLIRMFKVNFYLVLKLKFLEILRNVAILCATMMKI